MSAKTDLEHYSKVNCFKSLVADPEKWISHCEEEIEVYENKIRILRRQIAAAEYKLST